MKEKKLIFGSTAAIAVVILIIALVSINKPAKEEETSPVKGTNANGEVTTNFFDNIDVYEGEREVVTDADGNVIAKKSDDVQGEVVTDKDGNQVIDIDMNGGETDENGETVKPVAEEDKNNKDGDKKDNTDTKKDDKKDSKDKKNDNDKDSDDDGDIVDDFVVIEEDDVNQPTAENGETISEEYPGQADGWSPIVSPDELNNP